MAIALVTTQFQVLNTSTLKVTFGYTGSWGGGAAALTIDVPFEGGSLSAVIADIKTLILQHNTAAGGPSLKSEEIFFAGNIDPQISGVRKTSDQATTSTVFVDCDDLVFILAPNRHYGFKFLGAYTAAAATTGLQISVNGPASPSFIRFVGQIASSTTAVLMGAGAAYDAVIAGTASAGATPIPFWIEGSISTGVVGGVFRLRFRSEVSGSAVTILRGSIGQLIAV